MLTFRSPALTDGVSAFVLLLLVSGLALRRDRTKHPYLMGTAFLIDVGLVVYLQVTRSAVQRAVGFQSQILTFHVGVAVSALLLNLCLVVSGILIWKGSSNLRKRHRYLAIFFMVCRVLTLITAFFIPAR